MIRGEPSEYGDAPGVHLCHRAKVQKDSLTSSEQCFALNLEEQHPMGDEASPDFNGYERGIVRGVVYPDHRIYQYHSSRLRWRQCKDRATRKGLAEAAKNGVNAGTRERDAPPSGAAVSRHFVEL